MPPLTSQQRDETARTLIEKAIVALNLPINLSTTEILTLIGGVDDGLEANAAAINSAIPQPVRNNASTQLKALAVAYVALKRAGL